VINLSKFLPFYLSNVYRTCSFFTNLYYIYFKDCACKVMIYFPLYVKCISVSSKFHIKIRYVFLKCNINRFIAWKVEADEPTAFLHCHVSAFFSSRMYPWETRREKSFEIHGSPAKKNTNTFRLKKWNYPSDNLKQDGPQWRLPGTSPDLKTTHTLPLRGAPHIYKQLQGSTAV